MREVCRERRSGSRGLRRRVSLDECDGCERRVMEGLRVSEKGGGSVLMMMAIQRILFLLREKSIILRRRLDPMVIFGSSMGLSESCSCLGMMKSKG